MLVSGVAAPEVGGESASHGTARAVSLGGVPPELKKLTLALIAAEAASVSYALVMIAMRSKLGAFVGSNTVEAGARAVLIGSAIGAVALVAIAFALGARELGAVRWRALANGARLASPLLVAFCLPGLFSRRAFAERELPLLLTAALAVVAFELCMRRSLSAAGESGVEARGRPWLTHACLGALVVGYAGAASWASIRLHERLFTSLFDLGMFENLFYNTLHGVHGVSADRVYFGEHAELILYPLLPFYALAPRVETLLVLQSCLLGGAAVPLYLLARRMLKSDAQALGLAAAYLASPAVHGPNFYDFHFLTLSIFFVLWAAYFFMSRRWASFWVAVLLALACREDVSIGVTVVGAGIAWRGGGPRRRVGLALAALGGIWFVVVKLVWMRSLGGDAFLGHYAGLVAPDSQGFVGVLHTLLSNPLFVVGSMLTPEKLVLALHLLVPLAFLPLRRPWAAFLLVPGLLVVGLTTRATAVVQIHFQYVAHFVPYLFVAVTLVLATMPRPRRGAAFAALVLGSLIATVHFGAAFRNRYKVSFHEVSFAWSDDDARRLDDLRLVVERLPEDADVAASDSEGAHVARRRHLHGVKEGLRNAEFVLYGLASLRWGGAGDIKQALSSGKYGVVAREGEFALLGRGAPTQGNSAEIARLKAY